MLPTAVESRIVFGIVTMLSHVITLSSGRPSSPPTRTSDRMPRMVRVIGAQVRALRTSMAASRVSTHTGRRPAGGPRSVQKMSPLATTAGWCRRRVGAPPQQAPDRAGCAGRRPGAPGQLRPHRQLPGGPGRCVAPGPTCSSPARQQGGQVRQPGGHRVVRALPFEPRTYGSPYVRAVLRLPPNNACLVEAPVPTNAGCEAPSSALEGLNIMFAVTLTRIEMG